MAAADMRDDLTCSICQEIYTDPVSLPCGHNFCQGCIGRTWGWQESIEEDPSCPECRQRYKRKPELKRNRSLSNIAMGFLSTYPEHDGTGIFCNYCIHSSVPAAKSCLHCEASLCDAHVRVHSKSAEHVLMEPSTSLGNRKCSVHNELLKYYCCEDGVCICVSCCLAGEHRGHKVELLIEASEKKKEKLRNVLEKLKPEREETEGAAQRLQLHRREVEDKAAGETERITTLFRDIRETLEALEKRLLSDISRQKEELSLQLTNLIQELEIKKNKLSEKIHHIEELCNMADPLTVLQEQESDGAAFCGAEGKDNEDRERDDIKVPVVGHLGLDLISETLLTDLAGIVTGINGIISRHKDETLYSNDINTPIDNPIFCIPVTESTPSLMCGLEATDLALDINTAANNVSVSEDLKTAAYSLRDQCRPQTPERFQYYQALSKQCFYSRKYYWEVEGSKTGDWRVGVAYPSIERDGVQFHLGENCKSWCLCKEKNTYSVRHNRKVTSLPHVLSYRTIRISLDYEAGHLSFYELSEPIRHLHTFTANFTEPLHAAFCVGRWGETSLTIISHYLIRKV